MESESERLCFGGAPHIFQIICFTNMSGKGELWTTTTTLLMWPWPMRIVNRVKLTRWSWLDKSSIINYLAVIITYHQHQQLARGCRSSDAQLPHFPPAQIPVGVDGLVSLAWDWTNLFLSGCWAAGIEGRKLMNFNQVAFSFKTQGTNEPSPPASISNICPGTWNLALPLVMLSLRVCIIWV